MSEAATMEDPAVLRAERRLARLERLTEIGMELAEALRDRVMETTGDEAGSGKIPDPADAYARLSRAIRLTISLETRTDQALRDLRTGVVREREETRVRDVERTQAERKAGCKAREEHVERLVTEVIEAESVDFDDFERLLAALAERLQEDPFYADCGERPLRETVERLCRDLDLSPDWSLWSDEAWTGRYRAGRPPWDPFNQPSCAPIHYDAEGKLRPEPVCLRRHLE